MAVKLTIDGMPAEVPEGTTILNAARMHGITVPTLCYHKDLSPTGNRRICVVKSPKHASCRRHVSGWEGGSLTSQRRTVNSRRKTLG